MKTKLMKFFQKRIINYRFSKRIFALCHRVTKPEKMYFFQQTKTLVIKIHRPWTFSNLSLPLPDILRRLQALPQELHPPVHRYQLLLLVVALVTYAQGLHLPLYQSAVRLRRHGNHPAQLCVPGHDGDHRRGRVSTIYFNIYFCSMLTGVYLITCIR